MNMEKLLLNLFKEDINLNGKYSYISQISIITIKSLLPMKNEEAIRIDYERFEEEFKLWKYYRNGENKSLLNAGKKLDIEIYWNERDNSILSRIIPIVLANQNYNIIEEEIIKNILYTTGNIESLLENLSISYILNEITLNKVENIIDRLKDRIIKFSQIEFLEKYKDYYRTNIDNYPKNYKISFEREKIHLLNLLNEVESNKYLVLKNIIEVLNNGEPNTFEGNILYKYLKNKKEEIDLPVFYNSMGEYLINLRKSRIDPEKLKIEKYILPDIFQFKTGDMFFHSLLRDCKVLKKDTMNSHIISIVQTRTGIYEFKKMVQ